jgi:hypothetical protein
VVLDCLRKLVADEDWQFLVSERALDDNTNYAELDEVNKIIVFHPQKSGGLWEFAFTVVHEVLHVVDPEAQERTIHRVELALRPLWRPQELTEIMQQAGSRLEWEEIVA